MESERHLSKKFPRPIERRMSRSLTNLPQVMVTDADQPAHLSTPYLENLRETRSHPCSPVLIRRAFTTRIDGTQYIIGKLNLVYKLLRPKL